MIGHEREFGVPIIKSAEVRDSFLFIRHSEGILTITWLGALTTDTKGKEWQRNN